MEKVMKLRLDIDQDCSIADLEKFIAALKHAGVIIDEYILNDDAQGTLYVEVDPYELSPQDAV